MGELVQALDERDPGSPSPVPAALAAPVQGVLDRRFGDAWPNHTRSQGWSWRVPASAVVLSPAEARVDYAGPLKGWGTVVILRLGGGYRVVLAGLGDAAAEAGQAVSAGEPVGRMANAGKGAELYLEVRRGAVPVDPAPWLTPARAG
jgi:septal ring factor EnvC (AmiA/AmiB activator)